MSGEFHVGDNISTFGDRSVGKMDGGSNPLAALERLWGAPGQPDSKAVWNEPLVFVNYRNPDERAAVAIEAELTRRLGVGSVFLDARMPAGTEFPRELTDRASRCAVMISVIGVRWDDANGLRLLGDDTDWVRREINTALTNGVQIVPVLVGARSRLVANDLPADIRTIAHLQSPHLRHGYDDEDVGRLVATLLRDVPALAEAVSRGR